MSIFTKPITSGILIGISLLIPLSSLAREISLRFPPTQDRGAPSRTVGAGSRNGVCTQPGNIPMMTLMPANNVGTTTSAHPNLFVYIPTNTAENGELLILDENEEEIYQTIVSVPNTAGIIELSLPDTVALEVGQDYAWSFSLICNAERRDNDEFVAGIIHRFSLDPALEKQLSQTNNPLEQAQLYTQAGIWNETINILSQLRSSHPQAWQDILDSVGLNLLANVPIHSSEDNSLTSTPF